jgi:hypothetical protein
MKTPWSLFAGLISRKRHAGAEETDATETDLAIEDDEQATARVSPSHEAGTLDRHQDAHEAEASETSVRDHVVVNDTQELIAKPQRPVAKRSRSAAIAVPANNDTDFRATQDNRETAVRSDQNVWDSQDDLALEAEIKDLRSRLGQKLKLQNEQLTRLLERYQ